MANENNKLTYKSMFRQGEKVNESIVDVLIRNDARTSVWQPKKEGRLIADIIGVNSACQGKPIELANGFYERGFVNPNEESTLYLIDAEKKIIGRFPNNFNLFYDQDKVPDKNEYTWNGTFDEILEEFRKAGYTFMCPLEEK